MIIEIIAILLLVGIDQGVKMLVEGNMKVFDKIPVIDHFLYITHVQNTGVAFSFLKGKAYIMAVVGVIAIIAILVYYVKNYKKMTNFNKVVLVLITAGAIGNTIDRIFRGYVVDFIDFSGIWNAIFNIADSYMSVGVALLLLMQFLDGKREKKEKMEVSNEK